MQLLNFYFIFSQILLLLKFQFPTTKDSENCLSEMKGVLSLSMLGTKLQVECKYVDKLIEWSTVFGQQSFSQKYITRAKFAS